MDLTRQVSRLLFLGLSLLCAERGSAQLSQTVIPGPFGSGPGSFGRAVVFLPNGNLVVSDPGFDLPSAANAGAVHLYRASDSTLIATVTGSAANDSVGDRGISVLPSGDYLIRSASWNGAVGAVTKCDGATGCSGVVGPTNSAIGTSPSDFVGDSVGTAITSSWKSV